MKQLARLAPLLVLLFAGCIRIEQKLVLNRDASGSLEVRYTVPEETTQRIKAMLKLANELAEAGGDAPAPPAEDDLTVLIFDPNEDAWRKKIESYAAYGIRLDELEIQDRNARREVKLTLGFANIGEVAKADFFARYGFSLTKSSDGQYVFFTRPPTKEPLDPAASANRQEDAMMLSPLLGGFLFSLEVQTPGSVVKASDPDRQSQFSAQWIYDFDADQMAVAELQRKPMTIVFDSTGLRLPEFQQPRPKDEPRAATTNAPSAGP